jgi:hypothetical protein
MTNEELTALALVASAGIPHENIHASVANVTRLEGRQREIAGRVYATLIAEKKLAREPLVKARAVKQITAGREAMNRAWKARAELEARRDMGEI